MRAPKDRGGASVGAGVMRRRGRKNERTLHHLNYPKDVAASLLTTKKRPIFPCCPSYRRPSRILGYGKENMRLTTNDIQRACDGRLLRGPSERVWSGVSTDSRSVRPGDLFFALAGPRFDGHDFIETAVNAGAGGVVAEPGGLNESRIAALSPDTTVLTVQDTLRALGDVAAAWRAKVHPLVIGVTGSGGKTTTKEMIYEIVSQRYKSQRTGGNFNNLIGLPLTLLDLDPRSEVVALEMGMNAPGEIGRLCEIAQPNVGLITNVRPAHVGMLGGIENIAKAKGEMIEYLTRGGTFVRNLDDQWIERISASHRGRVVTFSGARPADVRLLNWNQEPGHGSSARVEIRGQEADMRLKCYGEHNIMNVLAAAAVGVALMIDTETIVAGAENFIPVDKRMKLYRLSSGVNIMDDSYNANPDAMELSLKTVADLCKTAGGRLIAVLGDMGELGNHSEAAHRRIGNNLADVQAAETYYLGAMFPQVLKGAEERGMDKKLLRSFDDHDSLIAALRKEIRKNDWILVKASRAMNLERIVITLREEEA